MIRFTTTIYLLIRQNLLKLPAKLVFNKISTHQEKSGAVPDLWRRSQTFKLSKTLDAYMEECHLRGRPFARGVVSLWRVVVRCKKYKLANLFRRRN